MTEIHNLYAHPGWRIDRSVIFVTVVLDKYFCTVATQLFTDMFLNFSIHIECYYRPVTQHTPFRRFELVSYCQVARLDSMVNVSELTLAVVRFEGAQDTLALTKR